MYIDGKEDPLVTYLYDNTYSRNIGVSYANGLIITYLYDAIGNIKSMLHNDECVAEYYYDANMNNVLEIDDLNNSETVYYYTNDSTHKFTEKTCDSYIIGTGTSINSDTGMLEHTIKIGSNEYTYRSMNDSEGNIFKYVLPNSANITMDFDENERTKNVYIKNSSGEEILTCTYEYLDRYVNNEEYATDKVTTLTYSADVVYAYTYDVVGNVTSINNGLYTTSYEYNNQSQLIRENIERTNETWAYTYDEWGNILTKTKYNYTLGELTTPINTYDYSYEDSTRGDLLTSYNNTPITYDKIGNPINWTYGRTLTWDGTKLKKVEMTDGSSVTYEYDVYGRMTKRAWSNGSASDSSVFIWDGTTLASEIYTYGDSITPIYYFYDENGSPVYCKFRNTNYYYIKNTNGDITGIMNSSGTIVAEYDYDSWGNIVYSNYLSANFMNVFVHNSLRYRGFVIDRDTGIYYNGNAYYDPSMGRMLNTYDYNELGKIGDLTSGNLYKHSEQRITLAGDHYSTDMLADKKIPEINVNENLFSKDSGHYVRYNVPIYAQGEDPLCWAYCYIMMSCYKSGDFMTQEEAYAEAKRLDELLLGVDRIPLDAITPRTGGLFSNLNDLYDYLVEKGPVYGYFSNVGKDKSHIVIITGVDLENGVIYINNPWGRYEAPTYEEYTYGYWAKYEYSEDVWHAFNMSLAGFYEIKH